MKVNPIAISDYWMNSDIDTRTEIEEMIDNAYLVFKRIKQEEQLREQHPILKELWENYQMTLKLIAENGS